MVLLGSCIACTEAKTTRSIRQSIHNKNDGHGCFGEDRCPERILERAKGIEPSYAAWEAAVLPLNYARNLKGPHYFRKSPRTGKCNLANAAQIGQV
jgi:hypothetical protein